MSCQTSCALATIVLSGAVVYLSKTCIPYQHETCGASFAGIYYGVVLRVTVGYRCMTQIMFQNLSSTAPSARSCCCGTLGLARGYSFVTLLVLKRKVGATFGTLSSGIMSLAVLSAW